MYCPHCGKEIIPTPSFTTDLKLAIEDRLTHYGFGRGNTHQKYQAYTSVRKVLCLFVEGMRGSSRIIDEKTYRQAIEKLDEILPPRKKEGG